MVSHCPSRRQSALSPDLRGESFHARCWATQVQGHARAGRCLGLFWASVPRSYLSGKERGEALSGCFLSPVGTRNDKRPPLGTGPALLRRSICIPTGGSCGPRRRPPQHRPPTPVPTPVGVACTTAALSGALKPLKASPAGALKWSWCLQKAPAVTKLFLRGAWDTWLWPAIGMSP